MDSWRVAVLGDGGVGKTALAVQVSSRDVVHPHAELTFLCSLPLTALLVSPVASSFCCNLTTFFSVA